MKDTRTSIKKIMTGKTIIIENALLPNKYFWASIAFISDSNTKIYYDGPYDKNMEPYFDVVKQKDGNLLLTVIDPVI